MVDANQNNGSRRVVEARPDFSSSLCPDFSSLEKAPFALGSPAPSTHCIGGGICGRRSPRLRALTAKREVCGSTFRSARNHRTTTAPRARAPRGDHESATRHLDRRRPGRLAVHQHLRQVVRGAADGAADAARLSAHCETLERNFQNPPTAVLHRRVYTTRRLLLWRGWFAAEQKQNVKPVENFRASANDANICSIFIPTNL